MAKKRVVVSICSTPKSSLRFHEGMRLALGLKSGWENHDVDILFQGDGAFCVLKSVELDYSVKFFEALSTMEASLGVEREALQQRNIADDEVFENVIPMSRKEIVKIFQAADHHISF